MEEGRKGHVVEVSMCRKVEVEVVVGSVIARREMWNAVEWSVVGQWMTMPGVDVRRKGHADLGDVDEMGASFVVEDCGPERWAAYIRMCGSGSG